MAVHSTNGCKIHLAYRQFAFARHTHIDAASHISRALGQNCRVAMRNWSISQYPQMEYSIKICGVLMPLHFFCFHSIRFVGVCVWYSYYATCILNLISQQFIKWKYFNLAYEFLLSVLLFGSLFSNVLFYG